MEANIIEQNGKKYRVTIVEYVENSQDKKVTNYEDVANKLFLQWSFSTLYGKGLLSENTYLDSFHSQEKAEQSYARTQLVNVATYLNEIEFKNLEWDNTQSYIRFDQVNNSFSISILAHYIQMGLVLFKSEEVAQRAIEILGEKTIKTALK